MAGAAGAVDEAIQLYEKALLLHQKGPPPLDRGRILLALGAAQRRAKRRRDARETLDEALGVFAGIGAELWAERSRAELARVSGRRLPARSLRRRNGSRQGKTNREVAAALFLSDRTVEGHLTHVFGKLGIKHRSEVGPALATRQVQGIAASDTADSPVETR